MPGAPVISRPWLTTLQICILPTRCHACLRTSTQFLSPWKIKSLRAISEHFRHTATRIYQQIALVWDIVTRAVLGTSLNTCVAPTAAHA